MLYSFGKQKIEYWGQYSIERFDYCRDLSSRPGYAITLFAIEVAKRGRKNRKQYFNTALERETWISHWISHWISQLKGE